MCEISKQRDGTNRVSKRPETQHLPCCCISCKKNTRIIYSGSYNTHRKSMTSTECITDKQCHQPRGTVVANKCSQTLQQWCTPKLEQKCRGSYMHEWQQGCSHKRRVQPVLRGKKMLTQSWNVLWKQTSYNVSRGTSIETLPRVMKFFLFFHFGNFIPCFSFHFLHRLTHASKQPHVISHLVQCCDRVKSKRLNLSLSLSVNHINSEHLIFQ